ncbi:MAG TPA: adenine phosphoribosyltransferase [Candidatus Hydrogenedentes bacterium]|nr:MAG: Adenine phosphoribosyltransferase [Candidatus Hydrogenedentes bacterium ADurb.Bin179]HOH30233.1 adenine phosphoribosyltransferase [Candidatus Hydrogenedentota bacterium]
MDLASVIRNIPDFPKPGIQFKDITTLLLEPEAFRQAIDTFAARYKSYGLHAIAGIEARGFIFGGALAYVLGLPFVLARKPRKLPGDTIQESFALEYGTDTVEMHRDAIQRGQRVLILDDLLATGGTVAAVSRLVERLGGNPVEAAFVIELPLLKGREKVTPLPVFSLVEFLVK